MENTPIIHAEVYSERRRNIVILCQRDRVIPYWLTTRDDVKVTCKKCQRETRKETTQPHYDRI